VHNFTRPEAEGLGTYIRRRSVDHLLGELHTAVKSRPKLRVIAFSDDILWDSAHHPHIFQVLLRNDLFLDQPAGLFDCRCPLLGPMVAVDVTLNAAGTLVTKAVALAAPDALPTGGVTKAIALIIDDKALQRLRLPRGGDIFVKLRGDFVIDGKTKRAIDAEFVRADLPTGDRPQGSNFGVQGGTFESWFTLKQG